MLGELDEAAGERWLFHGTSGKGVEGITNTDFRLDLAGTGAGLLYGRGIYLAESCMKADEYCVKVDTKFGKLYGLLVCRVCLGRVLVDSEKYVDPPLLWKTVDRFNFDSVCGDRWRAVGTFREFIAKLKGSVGEGPNQTNYSYRSSVRIRSKINSGIFVRKI